jgi:hypothetical protein
MGPRTGGKLNPRRMKFNRIRTGSNHRCLRLPRIHASLVGFVLSPRVRKMLRSVAPCCAAQRGNVSNNVLSKPRAQRYAAEPRMGFQRFAHSIPRHPGLHAYIPHPTWVLRPGLRGFVLTNRLCFEPGTFRHNLEHRGTFPLTERPSWLCSADGVKDLQTGAHCHPGLI